MTQEHMTKIEAIIGRLKCPKDFKCYKSGFEALCKAKDVGLKLYLECLEQNSFECPFSVSFGRSHYCKCPLRVYLAKELKK